MKLVDICCCSLLGVPRADMSPPLADLSPLADVSPLAEVSPPPRAEVDPSVAGFDPRAESGIAVVFALLLSIFY